jgi:predicted Zn-dependent protease
MNAGVPIDAEAMRLIAEIGFIGAQTGQVPAARALFQSLRVMRPDSTLPFIGLAMTELGADRADSAVRILREDALKQHPDDPELLAFLGLALQSAGRGGDAQKVLVTVTGQDAASEQPHTRMAGKLLELGKGRASPASLMPRWSEAARKATDPA